jgi:ubiquinone/menaquinone biosynthesis C-methylase UbiE
MSVDRDSEIVPALGYHFLTPLYDAVLRLTMRDPAFKVALLEHAELSPGGHVLDLGCGTGTLTLLAHAKCPGAVFEGLDADPSVLDIARAKAAQAGAAISFIEGRAGALPWPDAHFDFVLSSLLFHHLNNSAKLASFTEVRRVLKPGGTLLLADWGKPAGLCPAMGFFLLRCLDGFETTRAHVQGCLPAAMEEAGLRDVTPIGRANTLFGTLDLLRARR